MAQQHVVDAFNKYISSNDMSSQYQEILESGYKPNLILYPESVEDLQGIMKLANELQTPVYPVGAGTMFMEKIAPFTSGILLSTQKLKKVVEYRPQNMSIEVEAGLTIKELQKILAIDNIFYPVEPDEASATIGGQVAVNGYGRKKYMYKSSRFYVMGMEFISAQGDLIRVGGRTVKNVSGYDVSQLLAGSWGLFGVITKVTLRLRPLPEKNLIITRSLQNLTEVKELVNGILNEKLSLAALLLRAEEKAVSVQLELEGFEETVELQASEMEEKYGFKRMASLLEKPKEITHRAMLPLQNYGEALESLWTWAGKQQLSASFYGNVTNGVLEMELKEIKSESQRMTELHEEICKYGGSWLRGNNLKAKSATANLKLLQEIKAQIDPKKILVPENAFLKE